MTPPDGPQGAQGSAWVVRVSEAEARWLASPGGAPRDSYGNLLPGCIRHLGGGEVRMDPAALASLRQQGRVVWEAGGEALVIEQRTYPVVPDR